MEGKPENEYEIINSQQAWLAESDIPKLFINAEPGALLHGMFRDIARSWPNVTEVTVAGIHFIQEDSPDEIGEAISNWLADGVKAPVITVPTWFRSKHSPSSATESQNHCPV